MVKKNSIKLFGNDKIRAVWDDEQEKWYFSVVDVVAVLTESKDYQTARKYWNKLKQRLREEGFEPVTNCHQLKSYIKGCCRNIHLLHCYCLSTNKC